MPLREERDAFGHQLGEQPALVVGEDRVADLRQDHRVPVGRQPLDDEDQDGDPGQDHDAADAFIDIGLVDDLAEQIGRSGGGRRRDRHQRERQQIAPPVQDALFHHEAANQDRRAVGIVGDFPWKFGHPRSIDGAGQAFARASGLAGVPNPKLTRASRVRRARKDTRNPKISRVLVPAMDRFFKPNQGLH